MKGNGTQLHSGMKISIPIVMMVKTMAKIHAKPVDFFVSDIILFLSILKFQVQK